MKDRYILLVEDNEDDVFLTQRAFQKCQIPNKILVVYDGQEALDFLFGEGKYSGRDITQTPAVVLLDLKLPYVSGQEVLRKIRMDSDICRLPVVVLSSTTNMQEIEECEQMGINRYCRKPGNFNEFKKIIEDIRDSFLEKDRTQTRNLPAPDGNILPNRNHSD
jgi:two-component system, response regulator